MTRDGRRRLILFRKREHRNERLPDAQYAEYKAYMEWKSWEAHKGMQYAISDLRTISPLAAINTCVAIKRAMEIDDWFEVDIAMTNMFSN